MSRFETVQAKVVSFQRRDHFLVRQSLELTTCIERMFFSLAYDTRIGCRISYGGSECYNRFSGWSDFPYTVFIAWSSLVFRNQCLRGLSLQINEFQQFKVMWDYVAHRLSRD